MKAEPELIRLFGGPGSGKTTALLDRVADILDSGVDPDDVLLVSYTRAAAEEAGERLAERLDTRPQELDDTVCTMHSKAYNMLDLTSGDVVDESDKEGFCEDYGLPYENQYESGGRTARSTKRGNKIIATSQWLQRTCSDVSDWYKAPFDWNTDEVRLPPDEDPHAQDGGKYTPTWPSDDDRVSVPEAIRAWRTYKGDNDLVGFADMLERVKQRSLVPQATYLAVDEFQDITRLQHSVYEEWKPHMEKVVIAGDDDQVVYSWQGADPRLLLDEDTTEDIILDTSHRLPSKILHTVNHAISHVDERQDKSLKPRKVGGGVQLVTSPSLIDLKRNVRHTVEEDDGTIMVLFRARYQMFEFINEFIDEGMPFQVMTDQQMWSDRLTEYVTAVEDLHNDEDITGEQAERVVNMLADSAFGTGSRDALEEAVNSHIDEAQADDPADVTIPSDTVKEHAPFLPNPSSIGSMTQKITRFQRQSLEALDDEYRDMDPHRIRVGTIHSAKGREADHVFLSTDLTSKVVEHMAAVAQPEDIPEGVEFTSASDPVPILTPNERRVFYVGLSRARERLVILENLIDSAPTLPIEVLLHNEPRPEDPQTLLDNIIN